MNRLTFGIATLSATLVSLACGQASAHHFPVSSYELASAMVQDAKAPRAPEPQEKPQAKPSRPERQQAATAGHKQDKPAKQEKADKEQQKNEKKQAKQEQKAQKHAGKNEQATGAHGRIKDRDYQAHFGQSHHFAARRVITTTRIVPNQTRFVYVGYTFLFVDPWPMGWGFDDDVYIDYMEGGYYMFDPFHPGVRVALTIVG